MRNWTSQAMHCCRDKALQDSEMTDSRSLLRNPTWLTSLVGTARWVCGDKLSCYSNRQPTVTLSLRYFVPITRGAQNERGNENGNDSVNGLLYRPDGYISHPRHYYALQQSATEAAWNQRYRRWSDGTGGHPPTTVTRISMSFVFHCCTSRTTDKHTNNDLFWWYSPYRRFDTAHQLGRW